MATQGGDRFGRRDFLGRFGSMAALSLVSPPLLAGVRDGSVRFQVVAAAEGRFMGWPANHGLWHWENGREILVGHADGPWVDKPQGHKIGEPQHNVLARSMDGGLTWRRERPEPYVGTEADRDPQLPPAGIRLAHPDFALRVVAGNSGEGPDRVGRFFFSHDRGRSWKGPFLFPRLAADPRLAGLTVTSRTSYVVTGEHSALLLLSAMDRRLGRYANRLDKPFVVETVDGGGSFRFVAWVVPWQDPYRAVMPSTVRLPSGELLTALRRRDPRGREEANWIDLYGSADGGASWNLRSRVGETGLHNGNPPALVQLRDGRLACVYGNRSRQQVVLRTSRDGGDSWGEERVLRSNPFSYDLGYPQLVQNHRGELVALYYLATSQIPHSYIEAALFRP